MMRKAIIFPLIGLALLGTQPVLAAGIGHSFFMRGQVVDTDSSGKVVCIGSADGAKVGQVLEVYRVKRTHGKTPSYGRTLTGHVTVDRIVDEHFAHVVISDGAAAVNDVVELQS
jgi:hypothetical protein